MGLELIKYLMICGIMLWPAPGILFAEENSIESSEEKLAESSSVTSEEKSSEVPNETETSEEKSTESSSETQEGKPTETPSDTVEEKPAEASEEKPAESSSVTTEEKPAETPSETSEAKPVATSEEKPADKPAEASTETSTEKETETSGEKSADKPEETTEVVTDKKWYDGIGLKPLLEYYEKLIRAIEVFKQRTNPASHKGALEYSLDGTEAYKENDATMDLASLRDFVVFSYYQKIAGSMSGLSVINNERFIKEVVPAVGAAKFPTGFVTVEKYQAQRMLIYDGYDQYGSFIQGAILDKVDKMMATIIESIKTEIYKQVVKDYVIAFQAARKLQQVSFILEKSMKEKKTINDWLSTFTAIRDTKKDVPLIAGALEASGSMPRGPLMLKLRMARHRLYHYLFNKVPELSDDDKKNLELMYACENRVDTIYTVE